MNKILKILLIILSFISLLICSVWVYKSPDFDSGSAAVASLIAFIGLFFVDGGKRKENIKMTQKAGKNSKLFQSGGPMTIN